MPNPNGSAQPARFGPFEVDFRAGELLKSGRRIRLQDQPLQVLAMLLEHPGDVVTRDEFRQKLWPNDTFVDFDHGLNNAINRLRDALNDSAEAPRFVETLPKRGYRFLASVELVSEPSLPLRIESIAVLPLENLTGDPSQDFFVDGMTDALITRLAQVSALRVISRTSAMRYKGANKPLPQIARELNVDAVVEGAVARSVNRVRITAQLIHATTDQHLWASQYERDLTDVLLLQAEMARAIADEIQVKLTPPELARLVSGRLVKPEAYEAYLRGRFYWDKRTEGGMRKALELFEQALAQDPSYALSYAGVADCNNMLGFWGVLPPHHVFPKAKAAARKALEIDAASAEAYAAQAWPVFTYDWDWAGAEQELERAIQLNPGYTTAHQYNSHLLVYQGRDEEAFAEVGRTLELDPLSLVMNSSGALIYLQARRYDEAIERAHKTLDLDPHYAPPHLWLGWALTKKHLYKEASAEFQKAVNLSEESPRCLAGLGYGYALAGESKEAHKLLSEMHRLRKQRYISAYDFAVIHVGLGDDAEALTWLEQAYEERSGWLAMLLADSRFDGLHGQPRFQGLLKRIGLSA